uniref:Uncharacterized protein n=1 Tax=Tetranychus urticae TaxID=32264 RepID=T1L0Q7_TETUR
MPFFGVTGSFYQMFNCAIFLINTGS